MYSLDERGGCKLVGPCHEETEPSELLLPLGERRFPLFAHFTGDGLGLVQHFGDKLVFLTKRVPSLTAQAGGVAVF